MTIVRILRDWEYPDIMRQTPNAGGVWDGITFTMEELAECDYVIRFIYPRREVLVNCPPEHVWSLLGEPPTGWAKKIHLGHGESYRIFTSSSKLAGNRYVHSHPALPWHVDMPYDDLVACGIPEKTKKLSWVTSSLEVFDGHRARMRFLEFIRPRLPFDLYGRGFNPIGDKWNALASYRYSFAIENHVNEYYWSEKIADCFLAWTMPIYYGCTRINDYFPEEAMVRIDINDPDVVDVIQDAISGDRWSRGLGAIEYARELILNKYQFFPFIASQIRQFENCYGALSEKRLLRIPSRPSSGEGSPFYKKLWHRLVSL